MKAKPILFNTEMVQAILSGLKTQIRRVIKPAGLGFEYEDGRPARLPPYQVGDILWVRETWEENTYPWGSEKYMYKASFHPCDYDWHTWRPSVHMPKEAARIFLRVTNVRVERLQEISFKDLVAEGMISGPVCEHKKEVSTLEFSELWDRTIRPKDRDKYGWDANPWVWVIEFERCEKPEEWPNT